MQPLHRRPPHRTHQYAARLQLVQQFRRLARRGRRDHDAVERRLLRPAQAAVAVAGDDVVDAQHPQPPLRLGQQAAVALHRIDIARQPAQHRRLVAGPRADLQHPVTRLHIQRLGHQADDIGLADGLGAVDRQGLVLPGLVEEFLVHEDGAVDRLHRRQHPGVGHPLLPQPQDQPSGAVVVQLHAAAALAFGGAPPSIPFRSLTLGMWVRSMCSGVTEILPSSMALRSVPSACSCFAPRKLIQ